MVKKSILHFKIRSSFVVAAKSVRCWLQALSVSFPSSFALLEVQKFQRCVPTKRKTWSVKAMWRVCAGNSRTDSLTGFLREAFCQPEFPSCSIFFSQTVTSSPGLLSAIHNPPPQLPCGMSLSLTFTSPHYTSFCLNFRETLFERVSQSTSFESDTKLQE